MIWSGAKERKERDDWFGQDANILKSGHLLAGSSQVAPRNHGHRTPYQTRTDPESWEQERLTHRRDQRKAAGRLLRLAIIHPTRDHPGRKMARFVRRAVVVEGMSGPRPSSLGSWRVGLLVPTRGDPSIWPFGMNERRYSLVAGRRLGSFLISESIGQPRAERPGMASLVFMPYFIYIIASGLNIDQ